MPQCFFSQAELSILDHSMSFDCTDIEFAFRDPG